MIHSLEIQNYQSHKKSKLEFSEGINSIVGISDSGKTAILRALYWDIYNRPLGNDDISDWNKDKDSEPIKSTYVRVTNDKGIIERRRGKIKFKDDWKKFNGYILNGTDYLEAIDKNVPDEVSKLFNIDEVNFQGQFDPSFLLSNSAGEVAKFFNSTIRLDLIDRILSKADSKRLENNKEKRMLEREKFNIESEIAKFDWLDDAEELVNKIMDIDKNIVTNKSIYDDLNESISTWRLYSKEIKSYEVILSAAPTIEKINVIQESLSKKIEKYERLQNLYSDWKEQNNLVGAADFSIAKELINKIDDIAETIKEKIYKKEALEYSLEEYKQNSRLIEIKNKEIIESEKQLPTTCPLCGNKI